MPDIYDITAYRGDKWDGASFTITVNDIPLDMTGATAEAKFRRTLTNIGPYALRMETDDGLTITDAAGGVIQMDPRTWDIGAGVYYYDVEITLANGDPVTYIKGTLTLTQDVT